MKHIFTDHCAEFLEILKTPQEHQMVWCRSIQDLSRFGLREPWQGLFKSLGRCKKFQDLQVEAAYQLYDVAIDLAHEYELQSKRAVALMFDVKVQNGGIYPYVREQILRDFANLPEDGEKRNGSLLSLTEGQKHRIRDGSKM